MKDTVHFSTACELFTWLVSPQNNGKFYFRGISKEEQRYPAIMRKNEHDFSMLEKSILREFMKYGSSLVANSSNAFDCVAHAQHFGLPTRLVDWSRNPLVALFFSIYYADADSSHRLLLLPRKNTLSISEVVYRRTHNELEVNYKNPIRDYVKFIKQVEEGLFVELCKKAAEIDEVEAAERNTYVETIKASDTNGYMIMVEPGYSNQRILSQNGLFYFPRKLENKNIDCEYLASEVKTIEIHSEWRVTLLDMLGNAGISKYNLFFDLPTICSYIVEQAQYSFERAEEGFFHADLMEN